MKEAYIIDGIRTPIGNYTGTLSAGREPMIWEH